MISYALIRNTPFAYADEHHTFKQLLAGLTLNEVLNSKKYVEPEVASVFRVETQGPLKGARSNIKISEDAISLIIACEVTSKSKYNKSLTHPIWPKGHSGATLAFGYDIGQASEESIRNAWVKYLPIETIDEIVKCAGKVGEQGRICTKTIKHVTIPWDAANSQFRFYLPYVIAQTASAFDNFEHLSPDSRGALVSLVYNRGADTSLTKRREEMYNIGELMASMKFSEIPKQIRSMKRLWPGADQKGLIKRRELEATLFEIGMVKK
jgi:GH24 family phage-related lysozyme (muramidase)